jgi:hypothetical protein
MEAPGSVIALSFLATPSSSFGYVTKFAQYYVPYIRSFISVYATITNRLFAIVA